MSQKVVLTLHLIFLVSSAGSIQEIYREAESLKRMNHKNIIGLYHAFMDGKQLIMIMEYAGGGELLKYVEDHHHLEEPEGRKIFIQIVNAMAYCH